jgi:hypothetical protein
MQGLARLVGYRHGNRREVGQGIETDWSGLASRAKGRPTTFVVVDVFEARDEEEAVWLASEMDRRFLGVYTEESVLLASPDEQGGLLLEVSERIPAESRPFRAELLDDRTVPAVDLHEAIDDFLT